MLVVSSYVLYDVSKVSNVHWLNPCDLVQWYFPESELEIVVSSTLGEMLVNMQEKSFDSCFECS